MKAPKFDILGKKSWKVNMWKLEKTLQGRDHCHYTGKYRDADHSICNLKYIIPEEITTIF